MYPRIISPSTKRILSSSGLSSSLVSVRPLLGPSSTSPIHTSPTVHHETSFQTHSSDVYSKEVDTSPPEDTTMYHVNPEAPVQKWNTPLPPPSGDGNYAGTMTSEHQTANVSSQQPHGNAESWAKDKRGEGPEGRSKT